jgi:hypothetical protein
MFNDKGDGISYLDTVNDIATYGVYLRGYLVMLATVDQAKPDVTLIVKKPGDDASAYDTGHVVMMKNGRASSDCVRVCVFYNLPYLLLAIHDTQFAKHMDAGGDIFATANPEA